MDILNVLTQIKAAQVAVEEILMSQTKEELHKKMEYIKFCIDQDQSCSDRDKEFYKGFVDLFKKRIEMERGW